MPPSFLGARNMPAGLFCLPQRACRTTAKQSGWKSHKQLLLAPPRDLFYEVRNGKRETTGPSSYLAPAKISPSPGVKSTVGLSWLTSTSSSENAKALCAATDKSDHQRADRAYWVALRKCMGCWSALYWANLRTQSPHVSLHRPPTSHASVTSLTSPRRSAASQYFYFGIPCLIQRNSGSRACLWMRDAVS